MASTAFFIDAGRLIRLLGTRYRRGLEFECSATVRCTHTRTWSRCNKDVRRACTSSSIQHEMQARRPCSGMHVVMRVCASTSKSGMLVARTSCRSSTTIYYVRRKSSSTTSTTLHDQVHGVPRRRCEGVQVNPVYTNHARATTTTTHVPFDTDEANDVGGVADVPAMFYRLMDRRGHGYADAIPIYIDTHAWIREAKIDDDDHNSLIGGTP